MTFFNRFNDLHQVIIIEIQYAPNLFRTLKITVAEDRRKFGKWVLTGSQHFLLIKDQTKIMKMLSIIFVALALCTGCKEVKPTSSPPKESYTDECTVRIEQIHFVSMGDTIRGSIVFPKEIQPCPAVVLVPGSGKSTRLNNYARKFASKGIAALTYDKRGVGESGGRYRNRGNATKKNLYLLAKDVLAAVSLLSNHSGIDTDCIGLWAFSQGGWIQELIMKSNSYKSLE